MKSLQPVNAATEPKIHTAVLEAQRAARTGALLITPLRFRMYAMAAVALVGLLAGVLGFGRISRTFTATGIVLPAAGLIPLHMPTESAEVRWLTVEGRFMEAGDSLAEVRRSNVDGIRLRAPVAGVLFQIATGVPQSGTVGTNPMAWFAPSGPLSIQVAVPAEARLRIRVGGTVGVRTYGSAGIGRLQARVRSVALAPSEPTFDAREAPSYATIVDLEGPSDPAIQRQLLGLPAEVEFTLERRPLYAWLFDPARTLLPE